MENEFLKKEYWAKEREELLQIGGEEGEITIKCNLGS